MKDKEKLKKIGLIVSGASKAAMIIEAIHKDDLNGDGLLSFIFKICGDILEVLTDD